MEVLDANSIVENIEKFGDANGDPEAQPQENLAEENLAPEQDVKPEFNFKSLQDLLKHELEYNADGKSVRENLETILKRASQGYHYAQKMNQLNLTEKEWADKVKAAQESQEKWGKYDEYARQNPQWYEHWQNAWNQRSNPIGQQDFQDGQGQPPLEQQLQSLLEQKLAPFQDFMNNFQQTQVREKLTNEDRELDSQMQAVRKEHPNIDFEATDPENGKSLEYKVLEFASQNGIRDYRLAFKAFYHDNLVKLAAEQAKDNLVKEKQRQTKDGIIDIRSTPSSKHAPNLRDLTWDQVAELAGRSEGIG